jgi:hypothetical protein
MLSFAYLRNNGFVLYKDMVHVYPPLVTMILAFVYKIFGTNLWVLELSTWGKILINDLLIFFVSKKFTKSKTGAVLALGSYVLLQPFLEGNQFWFDLAITTPLLIALMLISNKKYTLASFFITLATFGKQTGVFFLFAYWIWLLVATKDVKKLIRPILVPLIVITLFIVRVAMEGGLEWLYNWVFYYPSALWTHFPGYVQMVLSKTELYIMGILLLPAISGIILVAQTKKSEAILTLFFVICGLISIYPRFSYLHFQTALPFIVIAYSFLHSLGKQKLMLVGIIFAMVLVPKLHKPVLASDWHKEARFYTTQDKVLAQKIQTHINAGEKLYILGLGSQLYALTHTLPPKPWVDNYPWYWEMPGFEDQVLASWQMNPSRYILWQQPSVGNWYEIGVYQPKKVVEWMNQDYSKVNDVSPGISLWQKKN